VGVMERLQTVDGYGRGAPVMRADNPETARREGRTMN